MRHKQLDLSVTLRDRAVDMAGEGIDLAVRIGLLGGYPDLMARRLGEQKLVILRRSRLSESTRNIHEACRFVAPRLPRRLAPGEPAHVVPEK